MTVSSDTLTELAKSPVLLVACDYDGTLADIVDDPDKAHPRRESIVSIRGLAELPQTHAAVVSGRSLRDLEQLTHLSEVAHLVGSHGSEFDADFISQLDNDKTRLLETVDAKLHEIAATAEGLLVERKPASVAFHYRQAAPEAGKAALAQVLDGPAKEAGVFLKEGKMVAELCVLQMDKGSAVERLRHRLGASAVLFIGDDVTDEDVFKKLTGPDVGIKVGDGETAAGHRVSDPAEVALLLAELFERRASWLQGAEAVPIESLTMLSDQRTAALVTPDGDICWLCAPRLDSPAMFAGLVGGPAAGRFRITPAATDETATQQYIGDTLTLETRWNDADVTLLDYLECTRERALRRDLGTRLVRVVRGTGRVRIEFAPRLDFGRTESRLQSTPEGLEVHSLDQVRLATSMPLDWTITREGLHDVAVAEVDLSGAAGGLTLELCAGGTDIRSASGDDSSADDLLKWLGANSGEALQQTDWRAATAQVDQASLAGQFVATGSHWADWVNSLRIPDRYRDIVARSALAIKGLVYAPTGAIAAAATTSLPEHIGGVRNWDYRYCWLRDGSLSADALVRLGSTEEALRFLDWTLELIEMQGSAERLHPVYTLLGHELSVEAELGELGGYAGSRPVRVGNGASGQIQLDVFGPVADLLLRLAEAGASLTESHMRLVSQMARAVERLWPNPDHGIWEVRGPRRHYVHSKVMCWVTIDRAIKTFDLVEGSHTPAWDTVRDAIAADVLERGFREDAGAFTIAYDLPQLDAACLQIGLSGMIAPDDERFEATVNAIDRALRFGPTVYRYRFDDGLPGDEGGFFLCASWLIDSWILLGRHNEARALFEELAALAGPTGLLPEQYDPIARRTLGNHPQAYSHIGLITNALHLEKGG